ncbi:hypothetical protein [Pseudoalteromonas rubra]|uniref:hypothetical protein n=1 Tax=Pseudoalteromonas rubra TaxID=43658 RepID=UPI000F78A4CE|nr:hypothetical protein [Pseudoalteromonas rubra]
MNIFFSLDIAWLLVGIAALILNYPDSRARLICISLVLISACGHYLHPIIKNVKDAYVYWELFGVAVNFAKLTAIYAVSSIHKDGAPRFAVHISSILLFGIAFRAIFYCVWVSWDSNVLVGVYQVLIPSLNAAILALMLINGFRIRLENRVKYKEDNGY